MKEEVFLLVSSLNLAMRFLVKNLEGFNSIDKEYFR